MNQEHAQPIDQTVQPTSVNVLTPLEITETLFGLSRISKRFIIAAVAVMLVAMCIPVAFISAAGALVVLFVVSAIVLIGNISVTEYKTRTMNRRDVVLQFRRRTVDLMWYMLSIAILIFGSAWIQVAMLFSYDPSGMREVAYMIALVGMFAVFLVSCTATFIFVHNYKKILMRSGSNKIVVFGQKTTDILTWLQVAYCVIALLSPVIIFLLPVT